MQHKAGNKSNDHNSEKISMKQRIEAFYRQSGGPNNPDIQRILHEHLLYGKDHGPRGRLETIEDALKSVISRDKSNQMLYRMVMQWYVGRKSRLLPEVHYNSFSGGAAEKRAELGNRTFTLVASNPDKAVEQEGTASAPPSFQGTVEEKRSYAVILSQLLHSESAVLSVYFQMAPTTASLQEQLEFGGRVTAKTRQLELLQDLVENLAGAADPHPVLRTVLGEITGAAAAEERWIGAEFLLQRIVLPNMYRLIAETSNEPLIRQTVSILLELAEQTAVVGFQRTVETVAKLDGNGKQKLFACLDRWIPRLDETIDGHREAAALLGIDVDDIKAHIINDYIQKIGQVGLI